MEVYKIRLDKEGQPSTYFNRRIYQNKGTAKALITKINTGESHVSWYKHSGYTATLVTFQLIEVTNG